MLLTLRQRAVGSCRHARLVMAKLPDGWSWTTGGRLLTWTGPDAPAHGFTTRNGGLSTGPFASLNISLRHGDEPAHVDGNLRMIRQDLGLERPWLATDQVHGAETFVVRGDSGVPAGTRADALLTNLPDTAIAVGVADCTPLLAWAPDPGDGRPHGVVLAIHAGWRGTAAGVVPGTLARAARDLGVPAASLTFLIGASARSCCYEVGDEVVSALDTALTLAGGLSPEDEQGSPPWLDRSRGKARVSPAVVARAQLRAGGVPVARIHDVGLCTLCHPDTWFSYRRDGVRSGRALGIISSAKGRRT